MSSLKFGLKNMLLLAAVTSLFFPVWSFSQTPGLPLPELQLGISNVEARLGIDGEMDGRPGDQDSFADGALDPAFVDLGGAISVTNMGGAIVASIGSKGFNTPGDTSVSTLVNGVCNDPEEMNAFRVSGDIFVGDPRVTIVEANASYEIVNYDSADYPDMTLVVYGRVNLNQASQIEILTPNGSRVPAANRVLGLGPGIDINLEASQGEGSVSIVDVLEGVERQFEISEPMGGLGLDVSWSSVVDENGFVISARSEDEVAIDNQGLINGFLPIQSRGQVNVSINGLLLVPTSSLSVPEATLIEVTDGSTDP
jgi:hypothetical protein